MEFARQSEPVGRYIFTGSVRQRFLNHLVGMTATLSTVARGSDRVARNGDKTQTKIMDIAEDLILEQGFSATSIDQIIKRAELTKGSFFYHFPTKTDLTQALVERYARRDARLLETAMTEAEAAHDAPIRQLLGFVDHFIAIANDWTTPYRGCLFASYCCEAGLFEERTLEVIRQSMLTWRVRIAEKLKLAAAETPPRLAVDLDSLADTITVVFEGAFILSRTLNDPKSVAQQLRHLKAYLTLLFDAPAGVLERPAPG